MFDDLRIVEPHSLELRDLLQTKEQKGCEFSLAITVHRYQR